MIGRPAAPQVPAWLRAKQVAGVKGDHAAGEMGHHNPPEIAEIVIRIEPDVRHQRSPVPGGGERAWAQQFPSGGIGHHQRQASIGVAGVERVHPVAIGAAGDELGRR